MLEEKTETETDRNMIQEGGGGTRDKDTTKGTSQANKECSYICRLYFLMAFMN